MASAPSQPPRQPSFREATAASSPPSSLSPSATSASTSTSNSTSTSTESPVSSSSEAQPAPPQSGPSQQRQDSFQSIDTLSTQSTSFASDDSQTIMLSNSNTDNTRPKFVTRAAYDSDALATKADGTSDNVVATAAAASPATPRDIDDEPPHCWICLQDEPTTADDDNDSDNAAVLSQWRSPCPCNLRAHEECILAWIADIESQPPHSHNPRILCPQCKARIRVSEPANALVWLADELQRLTPHLVLPIAVSTLAGFVYSGSVVYGVNAMDLVFGREEARALIAPDLLERSGGGGGGAKGWQLVSRMLKTAVPFFPFDDDDIDWRASIGLSLVSPALILSRTSLADRIFTAVPIMYCFLAFRPGHNNHPHWPPTPGLALAFLPYIRSIYNELYAHNFAALEAQWDAAVQRRPREGETAEQVAEAQQQARNNHDGGARIDIEFELLGMFDDNNNDNNNNNNNNNNIINDNNNAGAGQGQQQQPERPDGEQPEQPAEPWAARQTNISMDILAHKVIGALFFPGVCSVMGDVLRHVLPQRWVTKSHHGSYGFGHGKGGGGGILSEKWGRSIVGGCAFVVLRDAFVLYCKWRRARSFGKRKVLDYTRRKTKKKTDGKDGKNGGVEAVKDSW